MAMDFFDSQDVARRKTGRLVILFLLAVVAIMVMVYLVVGGVIAFVSVKGLTGDATFGSLMLQPKLMLGVGVVTVFIVGVGSLYKISQLRAGGFVIAESLGGTLVHPDTHDRDERKLLNVVQEMAIASGTPCPPVYLMQNERGINAFAAGYTPNDAVIGVTRGCIEQLSRDELQGVIGHEFSHILHGDMRLNIRLIGVLNGILIIGMIGYFVLRSSFYVSAGTRRSDRGGNALPLLAIGAGLVVVGSVGTFFGNWIKAAVSRQREFLADASAVQYTRNPRGIADALKRIGGFVHRATIEHPNAPQASHMYFGKGVTSGLSSLFATHPPLALRIKRIEPDWDGDFLQSPSAPAARRESDHAAAVSSLAGKSTPESAPAAHHSAVRQIGLPTQAHVEYAAELMAALPAVLSTWAQETYSARAVIFALLISREPETRDAQLALLAQQSERGVHDLVRKLLPIVTALDARARLPLIDLTIPSLREMSPGQYGTFKQHLVALIRVDRKVELFEWTLHRILLFGLEPHFNHAMRSRVRYYALNRLQGECEILLSMLAFAGHRDQSTARMAFHQGARHLGMARARFRRIEDCTLAAADEALDALRQVTPKLKRQIIDACATCIAADREVTVKEAELARAIAATLDCPMPPLLPGQPLI